MSAGFLVLRDTPLSRRQAGVLAGYDGGGRAEGAVWRPGQGDGYRLHSPTQISGLPKQLE